jgi:hypothetical protein
MREHDIGAISIGENDRLIGMVTDRDPRHPSIPWRGGQDITDRAAAA